MIAITGCARSGTAYTAALLCHLGYEVGHEALLADGIVSWPLAAKTRRAPWGPSPSKTLKAADAVFHQVREPLGAIRSIHTMSERSWNFVYETTRCRPGDTLLLRSAKYWLYWNRKSEKAAERTYRLESIHDEVPALCAAIGRPPNGQEVASVPRVNARANVVGPIAWDDLKRESKSLTDDILAMAKRYGYDVGAAERR